MRKEVKDERKKRCNLKFILFTNPQTVYYFLIHSHFCQNILLCPSSSVLHCFSILCINNNNQIYIFFKHRSVLFCTTKMVPIVTFCFCSSKNSSKVMSLHEVTSQQNCKRYEQFCTWKMSPVIARIQSLVVLEEGLHSSVRSHWEVLPL